ncbi:MAG: cobalt ECF transporter T component CbiQ [Nitrospirota bacterium]
MTRTVFLDRTLLAVARAAERSFFSEEHARMKGLLQSLDVRTKLLTFLFLIIVISFLHTSPALWCLSGAALVFAAASRIPVGLFLARVWLFVPLFSAAVVLPAVLNIVTPGEPIWVIVSLERSYSWGPYVVPQEIAVTRQGLWGSIVFVSRVSASVSFAVLLSLTTRWSDIFAGLRALLVPRIFVMTLSMTNRYLFVFLRLIQDMYRARKSRTIHALSAAGERGWVASRIGVLFRRSIEMSNDIYLAMISRGYHGEVITPDRSRFTAADLVWLAAIIALGSFLIAIERGMFR